ncbi:UTP--glucose-1-phosphate uridylyltransferase GalU [Geosporobacter ferrireducens]|uniref:UTP--glucose-1-phosphate uridylyltransferase GalU n=1 Tax=Geosporobacter ferrireducens TaxID=1424294 RepID=UPI00139DECF3|nr:UTP--glucose-1-phosphate uridylyltransferase GalU [Geosporobacter ferrireducens]MTI54061.1 UTP--glucose-1-phosphate uridylyltransferase GalU [Geosporobacter ferrireducens]
MKLKKAIIPAAGLGTRFLPATKAQPKEMLPIVDKPAIQYIIEEALLSGIEDILIITGRNKRSIEDHFDKSIELEIELRKKNKLSLLQSIQNISSGANIHYIRQKEPLGLGHAIYCAKSFIGNEPFAVLLGDDIVRSPKPCLRQLLDVYDRYQRSVLGVQEIEYRDVTKYGIISCSSQDYPLYHVSDLVEKPSVEEAPTNIAIMGRYIITPGIFEILEHQKPGKNKEIQLTDALKQLSKQEDVYAYAFQGKRYDVGDKLGYLQATIETALHREDLGGEFYRYLQQVIEEYRQVEIEIA